MLYAAAASKSFTSAPPVRAYFNNAARFRAVLERASDEELADLRRRIEATKWPDRETVADATQGVLAAAQRASLRLVRTAPPPHFRWLPMRCMTQTPTFVWRRCKASRG